jgi:hypothetical protein
MRSLMCRAVVCVTVGMVLVASEDVAMADKDQKITFTSAKVEYLKTTSGKVVNKTVNLEKTEAVETLVKFFPTAGQQRKSDIAAAWKAKVITTLTDKSGQEHKVSSNFEDWSEGYGDWPIVGKGFEEHIAELFKE